MGAFDVIPEAAPLGKEFKMLLLFLIHSVPQSIYVEKDVEFSKVWRKIFRPFLDYPLQQALFGTDLSRTWSHRKNTGKNLLMNRYIIR